MVLHPVVFTRKAANPWQEHELPAPSHQITHVRFWDANRGYAIGDESFYATEDGGQHWQTGKFHLQEKTLSEYPHEGENPAVFFLDSHDGWMSLQEPHHWAIYRTKDGGKEWRRIGTNDGWSFDKILFVSQTHGFGVGHSFQETVDGGVHWQPIETSFEVQDVFFLSPESGFLVSSRELYRIDIR